MAIPTSRAELIDYCLRSLGAPVLEINLDDDQISDRVDEAIQWFQTYHSDATTKVFYKYQITQTDFDNQYITLPESILYVYRIFPVNIANSSQGIFSVDYQLHLNDLYDLRRPGNLINYEMTRQYLSSIDLLLNGADQGITFTRHMNRMKINVDWNLKLKVGSWIIVEGQQTIDPDMYVNVYNDQSLKKYLTAILKKNWGSNLIKFEGMQLPGGVTLNGRQMYDDAKEEIKEIEEYVRMTFETPVDFYVG